MFRICPLFDLIIRILITFFFYATNKLLDNINFTGFSFGAPAGSTAAAPSTALTSAPPAFPTASVPPLGAATTVTATTTAATSLTSGFSFGAASGATSLGSTTTGTFEKLKIVFDLLHNPCLTL